MHSMQTYNNWHTIDHLFASNEIYRPEAPVTSAH